MTVTFFLTWSINSCMAHMYMWWISTLQRQQPIYFSSHFCCSDRMHGTLALAQPPGPPHIYSQINVVDESHSSLSTALLPLTRPSPSLTWASDAWIWARYRYRHCFNDRRIIHQPLLHVEIPGQFAHTCSSRHFRSGGSAPLTCHCEVTTQCVGYPLIHASTVTLKIGWWHVYIRVGNMIPFGWYLLVPLAHTWFQWASSRVQTCSLGSADRCKSLTALRHLQNFFLSE